MDLRNRGPNEASGACRSLAVDAAARKAAAVKEYRAIVILAIYKRMGKIKKYSLISVPKIYYTILVTMWYKLVFKQHAGEY